MSEQDHQDAVITVAVYPETKAEWEEAVEDDLNTDSLSQLIRLAVSQYLADQSSGTGGAFSEELHEPLTQLNTQQDRLTHQLDELEGQLADIREAVVGSTVGPETEALADDIFELLPSEKEVQTDPVLSEDERGVPAPEPGSIEWLTEQFEAPRFQIQTALEHLQETTYAVQHTDDGLYYTEV